MFTGIIRATVPVVSTKKREGCLCVHIRTPRGWKLSLGESISVDGICSTVVRRRRDSFEVEYMPETLLKTTAGTFEKGSRLNLERPLLMGAAVDGHFVLGHVDARADVISVVARGGVREITIALPPALRRFVALHGSITVNGVALTVARLSQARCTVALIPYTLAHTNLGALAKGARVNIEVDIFARHVVAALEASGRVGGNAKEGIRKEKKRS